MDDAEKTQSVTPDRSRRVYVWWAVGFAFLAMLGLFCLLVVRPVLEVRRAAQGLLTAPLAGYFPEKASMEAAVAGLGGPELAARKISLYLRVPDRLAGDYKWTSGAMLGCCRKPGMRVLRDMVCSPDEDRRRYGLWGTVALSLYCRDLDSRTDEAVSLEALTKNPDPEVAALACELAESLIHRGAQDQPPK